MDRFAATCDAVAATTSKNEKVRLVAEFLSAVDADDAARAALFFCGRAFPRTEERVLNTGGSLIWQALERLLGGANEIRGEMYRRHGDLGDMAA